MSYQRARQVTVLNEFLTKWTYHLCELLVYLIQTVKHQNCENGGKNKLIPILNCGSRRVLYRRGSLK